MERRNSILDLIAIALGIAVIFSASAFAQGLEKGTTPAETSISTFPAYCSELTGAFRVCRVRLNDDGDAEFQIQKLGATVSRIDGGYWSGVATEPKDFFAYRGDMDDDGVSEIVLVELEGVSQGMGVSYSTAYIFDGRTVESGGTPISIPIQEFGDRQNFIYDRRTRMTRVLITYWADYDSIEPKRGPGLYLLGKWFDYKAGKLRPVLSEPTLARRFLNSFAGERNNEWFEDRRPFAWLRDRRTHKLSREPKLKTNLLKVRLGTITSFAESDGEASKFKIAIDGEETIDARLGHLSEEEKDLTTRIDGIGIGSKLYLYPNPRQGGIRLSSFTEKVEGRRVRVETYKSDYGDEFVRIWLVD